MRRWLNRSARQLEQRYKAGTIDAPELDAFFVHDRCVRESGHDTTYRWDWGGDRCADFVTVDLNSLLYKMELDIARILEGHFGGRLVRTDGQTESAARWRELTAERKKLILDHLWDEELGMFFDYDFGKNHARHVQYISATAFYPLWAWHPDDPDTRVLSREKAEQLVVTALSKLETLGGVSASTEKSRGELSESRPARQWDYPYGWAPHQMLIWRGLLNYGFEDVANRINSLSSRRRSKSSRRRRARPPVPPFQATLLCALQKRQVRSVGRPTHRGRRSPLTTQHLESFSASDLAKPSDEAQRRR